MTKTPLIAFRCPKYLQVKLDAESAKKDYTLTETLVRRLCKAYGIKYQETEIGRPKKDPK